ncbi:chaplin [Streptomyces sp. NPDC005904]|uniref:chaplin n=1 Tax=Streptomyces sp. NPDC005904 TaxID=3154570 RepID=UPI0033E2E81F
MLSAAAATSILSLSGGSALAASGADGPALNSPGILSGNSVQAPVEVPVNVCGNSVDAVGAANPAFGNKCANTSSSARQGHDHRAPAPGAPHPHGAPGSPGAQHASPGPAGSYGGSGAAAQGATSGSPGVLSGNSAKAPVSVPVNVCGNSVDAAGVLNPTFGNRCGGQPHEHEHEHPGTRPPGAPEHPEPRPAEPGPREREAVPPHTAPGHVPHSPGADRPVHAAAPEVRLAETGTDEKLLGAAAVSTGLLVGGAVLYRRGRTASARR